MSLESKLDALTHAVTVLTARIESMNGAPAAVAPQVAVPAPAMPAIMPQVAVPAPQMPTVPAMPAPPMFAAPVNPTPAGAPFNDPKGMIDYIMGAYKTMGPQKGAAIQNILVGLGYQNINDVKPEHYPVLWQQVEALKGA